MAKQTFGSFKELLVRKELSDDNAQRDVRYESLGRIFRYVQADIILSNAQHFEAADIKAIKSLLSNEQLRDKNNKISAAEVEKLVKKGLESISLKTKALLCELLDTESKVAQKETRYIETLAEKFHPKDSSEELIELKTRIKEIQLDIVDIEMNLMTLENDGKTDSEFFKKATNARERRRQLVLRLEKQIQGVERKQSRTQKV
jgi:hypothetical protein